MSDKENDYEIPIKYIEEDDWEPKTHPPDQFRDKSNGE